MHHNGINLGERAIEQPKALCRYAGNTPFADDVIISI